MLTLEQEIELENLLQEDAVARSRGELMPFTYYTFPGFTPVNFHRQYYKLLNKFAKGEIRKLMISVPPQHGKSEGSTRRLPAFLLGLNPDRKIAVASYNATVAQKFNRDVQRIIEDPKYAEIFPDTRLNEDNVVTVSSNYLRNSTEFEIVGHHGGLRAVGRGGPLTSFQVDVMIMDDLYKDYAEGNSPIVRQAVWDWYTSTVKSRLHNDSQELMVFTRWHEDDLIGAHEKLGKVVEVTDVNNLPEVSGDVWLKINFPAIQNKKSTKIDPRPKGEPLWPQRHSLSNLQEARDIDPKKFACLYQGNPEDKKGQLYGDFKTYTEIPGLKIIRSYTDTADTGEDNLCSIVYGVPLSPTDPHRYILDVLYTDEPMEDTEPATIDLFNRNQVRQARIESNNGGRGFARVVQKGVKAKVDWFHQGKNKESRIYSNSAQVVSRLVMPSDWHIRWPEFYSDVTKYKSRFAANKKHDAPDTLTGIIEWEEKPGVSMKSAKLLSTR